MKKILVAVLLCLVLTAPVAAPAFDQTRVDVVDRDGQPIKSIVFVIGRDEYFVDGQIPGVKMDVAPFIENDRTYVPVRFLANALGVTDPNISWDPGQSLVTLMLGDIVARMTIGEKTIVTNGQPRSIDVAPQIKPPGRTFLPARYIAEALGYEVDWQEGRYVVVWPQGQPKPDVAPVKQYVNQAEHPPAPNNQATRGYVIPVKTDLDIELAETIELSVLVKTWLPLESQYVDLTNLLTSKFDRKVVDELVAYVKTKTDWKQKLPLRQWRANGYILEVISNGGNDCIHIRVDK